MADPAPLSFKTRGGGVSVAHVSRQTRGHIVALSLATTTICTTPTLVCKCSHLTLTLTTSKRGSDTGREGGGFACRQNPRPPNLHQDTTTVRTKRRRFLFCESAAQTSQSSHHPSPLSHISMRRLLHTREIASMVHIDITRQFQSFCPPMFPWWRQRRTTYGTLRHTRPITTQPRNIFPKWRRSNRGITMHRFCTGDM